MKTRDKIRLRRILKKPAGFGWMRGTGKEIGDIVAPAWDGTPWDCELGIAYRGENGEPVYYTGDGTKTTDDLKQRDE
jgi:hypothetical protein